MNDLIALDARMAGHSGIGTYIRGILSAFTPEQLSRMALIGKADSLPKSAGRVVHAEESIYGLREQWSMAGRLRDIGPALFHAPHFNIPLVYNGPLVVTVHDIIHLLFPQFARSPFAKLYSRFMLSRVAARASIVMTDSECTRRDLLPLGFRPEQVRVVPLAISERFAPVPKEGARAVAQRYGLEPGYLLYVGNLRLIKNVPRIVEAYKVFRGRFPDAPPLVLAGRDQIPSHTAGWKSLPGVKFLSEVSLQDLPALYSAAGAFVFPSIYEGFGLPPLEALSCGCPVISSSAGSLPEVLGDAAVYVDPYNVEELADAMKKVLSDESLRNSLRERGLAQARKFSWDKTARAAFSIYEEVLSGKPSEVRS